MVTKVFWRFLECTGSFPEKGEAGRTKSGDTPLMCFLEPGSHLRSKYRNNHKH